MPTPDRDAVLRYLARCVRDKLMTEEAAAATLRRFDAGENVFPMGLPMAPHERATGSTVAEVIGLLRPGEMPEL